MKTHENKIVLINENYSNSYPSYDTPVSYDNLGNVISRFGDNSWDFSYYIFSPNCRKYIHFMKFNNCKNIDLKNSIIYEYKLIIYGLIYCNTNTSKQLSIQTITGEYCSFLRYILNIAITCNTTLSNISKKPFLINQLFKKISFLNRQEFRQIPTIFKRIGSLSITFTEHDFTLKNEQYKKLCNFRYILKDIPYKQNLVIPSNLYFKLNTLIDEKLEEFIKNSEHLFNLYSFKEIGIRTNTKHNKYIKDNNIIDFCLKNKINNFHNLNHYLFNIIYSAQTKLLMFSGMRHSEAILLPFNCLEVTNLKNNPIYTLNGYTSKLTRSGPIKTTWITSSQVQNAINILQLITKSYLHSVNIDISSIDLNKLPLACFVHRTLKNACNNPLYGYPLMRIINIKSMMKAFSFDVKIDINAMRELEITTSNVDIENYNLDIGSDFPFTPHQFRRSLAVYTARSGYVKIPALKAQLKHISQDMTSYYANNALDTVNLFDSELLDIFNEEIVLDQYLNFKDEVINSINKLYGSEGTRLQNAKTGDNVPLFISDEKAALKDIKEGKMTYKRTPLGGCTKISSCDEIAELTITSCITCKDAIFSDRTDKALQIALRNFQNQLKLLTAGSPYAIHLVAEINQVTSLINKRKKILEDTND